MVDLAQTLGGLVLLYLGAEWLVAGASGLALSLRVPQLIVGLTVVAFGTSAPEMVVGIQAAYEGHGPVALGNVIGSNIANLGLILGLAVLLRPAQVEAALRRRELPMLLGSAAMVPILLLDGEIGRPDGVVLLAIAIAYVGWMIRGSRDSADLKEATEAARETAEAAELAGATYRRQRPARLAGLTLLGLGVLIGGGDLFVNGATGLARSLGMSERIVGLTIVAIGTSLPELATSLVAASRGHSDIVVGNVLGSNIFNVLLCLGAAGITRNIDMPIGAVRLDLTILLTITIVAMVFMRTARTIVRLEGFILLAMYLGFLVALAV